MDDEVAKEIYDLLVQNYVEDDDAMFRFDYSIPFLRWALSPPGQKPEWIIGVRAGKKNKLFGVITGIQVNMTIKGQDMPCAEINFLCVHKGLREKRLAPVLIKEITRRVNLHNIWQAIYTAGVTIPTPFTGATYWHRSLNPKKLVDIRFSVLPAGTPMAKYIRMNKLPASIINKTMRPMEQKDVP
jgi:glycylpeptide N-tetradecanoyltransferase